MIPAEQRPDLPKDIMSAHMITLIALFAAATLSAPPFALSSTGISDGRVMSTVYEYAKNGCTGQNQSPPLEWTGAPTGTMSFALTIHDPDAHAPGGWWHWVIFDIPSSTTALHTGAGDGDFSTAPAGSVEGTTSFGNPGYGGPCPPVGSGVHHYVFTLYALDVAHITGASSTTDGPSLIAMIAKHALGKATLTGVFSRQ